MHLLPYNRIRFCGRTRGTGMPSQSESSNFWAKVQTSSSGEVLSWHSLRAHCADVAAVVEALLQHTVLNARLSRLMGRDRLLPGHVVRLCFLGALHDAGKVNHGFQDRLRAGGGRSGGHVQPFVDFVNSSGSVSQDILNALGLAEILSWFGSEDELLTFLLAAFGHHGRPVAPTHGFREELWRP
ncbi:MAG: CRISPR-associated endonuclease Cas3'', partial [Candidatus Brocadiia bacterium]